MKGKEMTRRNIIIYAAFVVISAVLTSTFISCAKRQTAATGPEVAVPADCPPGAKYCPTPKADTAKPGAGFGRDSATVGQLAEPVTAKVRVYPAAADKPSEARARIPAGTWLLPEEMLDKPY